MKNVYSFLLASAAALGVQAQNATPLVLAQQQAELKPLVVSSDIDFSTLGHDIMSEPETTTATSVAAPSHIAAKATEYAGGFVLEENQYIVGCFTNDDYYSFTQVPYPGPVLAGAMLSGSRYEKLKNARALGIRFCLPEDWVDQSGNVQPVLLPEVTAVTLHSSDVDVIIKEVEPRSVSKGWNYVRFKTPQELDPVGVFISYTYTQTADANCFGICFWGESVRNGSWTRINNPNTGKEMWSDVSNQIGAICIQLIVEADPLPDYDLVPTAVNAQPSAVGLESQAAIYFTSNSKKDIENFEYTIAVGDKSVTRTSTLNNPIKAGVAQQAAYYMTIPAVDQYGKYDASITVNKVNGEPLAEPATLAFKQDVYTRLVQRHSVVEEWTGTGCGNCPRGWAGMEYLKEHYADVCIPIAVHQYNSSDPMYCGRYGGLGLSAAPACKIDRKTQADPYYGTDNTGIHKAVEYYSTIAPAVDVTVRGEFTDNKDKISCTADVEWLFDSGKYTIAYVLTADGLTGKGAWLQQNYYAAKSLEGNAILPDIPEFKDFFSGGTKGKSAVELVYNDVMVGSSWSTSGSNLAKSLGTSKHTAGEKLTNAYTCSISVSDVCKKAMDYDNLYVTAIILDANNEVVNAARAKVTEPTGINTVLAPTTTFEAYDLSGRRLQQAPKGVSIVGGRKVLR